MPRFEPYGDIIRNCAHGDECEDLCCHAYRCECKACCTDLVGRVRLSQDHGGPLAAWAEYVSVTRPLRAGYVVAPLDDQREP